MSAHMYVFEVSEVKKESYPLQWACRYRNNATVYVRLKAALI